MNEKIKLYSNDKYLEKFFVFKVIDDIRGKDKW